MLCADRRPDSSERRKMERNWPPLCVPSPRVGQMIPANQPGSGPFGGDAQDAQMQHPVDGILARGGRDQIVCLRNVTICTIGRHGFLVWTFSGSIAASIRPDESDGLDETSRLPEYCRFPRAQVI